MRFTILLALALGAGAALPAAAQKVTALTVPANASWKHAGTGLILRPKIAGLPRGAIVDSSTSELDVMVQYAQEQPTTVTVYIFRPALMSVPMWFDRAETQILLRRDSFGAVTPYAPIRPFAAPHAAANSALQRVYVPGKGPYKSSGLAVAPLGEWLVVVRASSTELDPAALDTKLGEIVAGIVWPETVPESPAAVPIAPCAAPLAYPKKAKLKAPDMTQSLMGALVLGVAADKAEEKSEKPGPAPVWCREGMAVAAYGAYRADSSADSYVLAIADAGRVVQVYPALALDHKDAGFTLTLGDLDRQLVYPNFDKLPRPEVAIDAVQRSSPVSSVARGGKNVNIYTK